MKIFNLALLLILLYPFTRPKTDDKHPSNNSKPAAANLVFKSADGGQTWQDISEGLPENWQGDHFFASETGLYVNAESRIFRSTVNATAPFWKNEPSCNQGISNAPFKTGTFQYNYNGQYLQNINGTSVWSAMYTNFKQEINTAFEAATGTVFIGSNSGLFKSTNSGKTWKQVYAEGWVMKLAESNGVLLATSQGGILRSADAGETWEPVINEGGVGIALEAIKGGFAAITYNTASKTRRVRTSYDGGKTWQAIDVGLKADALIASIIEVEGSFYCGHPDGIFRSSDKGKTWKLLLPSIGDKVFNLFTSGKVLYAIPKAGGC